MSRVRAVLGGRQEHSGNLAVVHGWLFHELSRSGGVIKSGMPNVVNTLMARPKRMGLLCCLLILVGLAVAKRKPSVDPKVAEILTSMVQDVLEGEANRDAREFYGTEGDKTVILLDGSEYGGRPVEWPPGFIPSVAGYTFLLGHQECLHPDMENRRLAIRLDRCVIDTPDKPENEKHILLDKSPIRIDIQNGGGCKNGGVMGGRTTWYSFVRKNDRWVAVQEGSFS